MKRQTTAAAPAALALLAGCADMRGIHSSAQLGNWIKVVQRVPVRIALEPEQVKAHPLRVGLSMEARVDVADQSGAELASAPRTEPLAQTRVFAEADGGADDLVRQIIARNMGTRHAS